MSHQQLYQPAPGPGAPTYGTAQGSGAVPAYGSSPATLVHWVVPSGRSWQSITAGYVALFAIFIWPLGPVALGLGAWAFARARHGGHGRGRATFAVIVGAVTTLLLLLVLAYTVKG
ncbi:hypothetical protein ACFPIJ_61230 [Dactylosporangium cerinum]|uniref:DUF4190 domain-containing protein n=1 Tax=Dactylosporangium cerinum TaxID=1434730 RepID=A0ABV9WHB0_9ACTN